MSSTVLVRLPRSEEYQNPALTPLQTRLDGWISHFTEEATNPQTLASLVGSSLAYRYGRVGLLSLASSQNGWMAPLLRLGSYGVGLCLEGGTYEGIQRSISSLKGDRSNPRLW